MVGPPAGKLQLQILHGLLLTLYPLYAKKILKYFYWNYLLIPISRDAQNSILNTCFAYWDIWGLKLKPLPRFVPSYRRNDLKTLQDIFNDF